MQSVVRSISGRTSPAAAPMKTSRSVAIVSVSKSSSIRIVDGSEASASEPLPAFLCLLQVEHRHGQPVAAGQVVELRHIRVDDQFRES